MFMRCQALPSQFDGGGDLPLRSLPVTLVRSGTHPPRPGLWPVLSTATLTLTFLVTLASPSLGQTFCSGWPIIVQDTQLQEPADLIFDEKYTWTNFGGPLGMEINNMGFYRNGDVLYALKLTPDGNDGIVEIDSTGSVSSLGSAGLPPDQRFDAGDVRGDILYVNRAGLSPLYLVNLVEWTTTSVDFTGGGGFVHDWAAHPTDGLLYGGDSSHGQLAVLDPINKTRRDYFLTPIEDGTNLPKGVAFGAAWFGPKPAEQLTLLRNDGILYTIDVENRNLLSSKHPVLDLGVTRAAEKVTVQFNDGAACPINLLDVSPQDFCTALCKACESVGATCTNFGTFCICQRF